MGVHFSSDVADADGNPECKQRPPVPALAPMSLAMHTLLDIHSDASPIVLLHGWGSSYRSWFPLVEQLQQLEASSRSVFALDLPGFGDNAMPNSSSAHFPVFGDFTNALDAQIALSHALDAQLDALAAALPKRCVLVGWSLGGMLAVQFAARYPERVESLISIAANACFSARQGWGEACEEDVFQQFYAGFEQAPEATLKRFALLQSKGDAQRKQVGQVLQQSAPEVHSRSWLSGLAQLHQLDNRQALRRIVCPILMLLGEHDALVPSSVSAHLLSMVQNKGFGDCVVLESSGHAPHISQPQLVAKHLQKFIYQAAFLRRKRDLAKSFSRAAETYDKLAGLQKRVADKLLLRCSAVTEGISCAKAHGQRVSVADLGCGTGYCSEHFARAGAEVISLDIASGMLAKTQARVPAAQCIQADLEYLPFAPASLDHVVSSLSLQWCDDTDRVFRRVSASLRDGGECFLATLLPGTLFELDQAWQQVDSFVHVNNFLPAENLRESIDAAGLQVVSCVTEVETMWFASVVDIMHSLKGIGAHNINAGQNRGLTSRSKLKALAQAYEAYRQAQGLPTSYTVAYLHLRKPAPGEANSA